VPLSEQQRLDRQAMHIMAEQKRLLARDDYYAWCVEQCVVHGVQSNAQRSRIWLDILHYEESSGNSSSSSSSIPYWTPADTDLTPASPAVEAIQSPANCHEHVMNCDIARSLWHVRDELREERRRHLKIVMMRCLQHSPELHYYQGLHELVGAILSIVSDHLPTESQVQLVDLLLRRRWYIFCHASLKRSESLLSAVHRVVALENPQLARALEGAGVGPSTHYALPWVITWFTHHHAEAEPVLCRLFDFLVGNKNPHAVVSLAAALVLSHSTAILELTENSSDTEGDDMLSYARAFTALTKLPNELLEASFSTSNSESSVLTAAERSVDTATREAQHLLAKHAAAIDEETLRFERQNGLQTDQLVSKPRANFGFGSVMRSVSMMVLISAIGVANYLVIMAPGASS
jgi:hypothetical protein